MQLYFIRHGQSANNLLYERQGSGDGRDIDPELSDYGQRQVKILAEFLTNGRDAAPATRDASVLNIDGYHLTHVYASPMIRALETAAPIAEAFGLRPAIWPDLHETGGMWHTHPETEERVGVPGPDRAFFEERYPRFALPDSFGEGGWWKDKPFEDEAASVERARRFWRDLEARHGGSDSDDRVAVVSHGMFYNVLLSVLLNLPAPRQSKIWFSINNAGITRIDFELFEEQEALRIAYHNRVDFLPPELVT